VIENVGFNRISAMIVGGPVILLGGVKEMK